MGKLLFAGYIAAIVVLPLDGGGLKTALPIVYAIPPTDQSHYITNLPGVGVVAAGMNVTSREPRKLCFANIVGTSIVEW